MIVNLRLTMPLVVTLLLGLTGAAQAEGLAPITLEDLAGKKLPLAAIESPVVVIDLWATWCEPCVKALPRLDALAKALGPEKVTVIALSQDEDRALVARFIERHPLPNLRVALDVGHRVAEILKPEVMPTTVVLRRDLTVVRVISGYEGEATDQKLRAAIREALGDG